MSVSYTHLIDLLPNDYYMGDLAQQSVLEDFARKVIADHGHVDFLVNNALPLMQGIDTCTYEEFNYALQMCIRDRCLQRGPIGAAPGWCDPDTGPVPEHPPRRG